LDFDDFKNMQSSYKTHNIAFRFFKTTFYKAISCNKDGEPEISSVGRPKKLAPTHYLHINVLVHLN
jgi:hypothetical protein